MIEKEVLSLCGFNPENVTSSRGLYHYMPVDDNLRWEICIGTISEKYIWFLTAALYDKEGVIKDWVHFVINVKIKVAKEISGAELEKLRGF